MARMRSFHLLTLFVAVLIVTASIATAENNDPRRAAGNTGFAAKKPVFGGACKTCPWGAIADFVKAAMQFYGYDVQVCYNCAGGPMEARLVAGAKMPPPIEDLPGI